MTRYANNTAVKPERTMAEIQSTLARYGATAFAMMLNQSSINVGFEMQDRRVRFTVPLPPSNDFEYIAVNQHSRRPATASEQEASRTQAAAQCWRALLLVIKAKLESVESGIETFEDAFMAQLVIANGQTMGEWARPQIEQLYNGKQLPPMLGSGM